MFDRALGLCCPVGVLSACVQEHFGGDVGGGLDNLLFKCVFLS